MTRATIADLLLRMRDTRGLEKRHGVLDWEAVVVTGGLHYFRKQADLTCENTNCQQLRPSLHKIIQAV